MTIEKNIGKIILIAVGSVVIFWLPFMIHLEKVWGIKFGEKASMQTIVTNFDGLNYLVIEKTWYKPRLIENLNKVFLTGNPPIYFTAHYPGYAALIGLSDIFLSGDKALLVSIIISNILLAIGLYMFFQEVTGKKETALYLSVLALFLPARMLSVRGVGSSEPLFMFFTLMSLVYAMREKHWRAGIMGALAVLTRSPGILLFGGYGLFYLIKYRKSIGLFIKNIVPYSLIPLSLVGLWIFYGWRMGSFWAYFQSGDNLHLFWPPFKIFANTNTWVSSMWLEDIIYIYLLFSGGVFLFWQKTKTKKKLLPILWWGVIYLGVIMLVAHRDLSRYSLPIAPVVLTGYGDQLAKSKYKWWLLWLVIPVMLWGWRFVLSNIQPVSDWRVFL